MFPEQLPSKLHSTIFHDIAINSCIAIALLLDLRCYLAAYPLRRLTENKTLADTDEANFGLPKQRLVHLLYRFFLKYYSSKIVFFPPICNMWLYHRIEKNKVDKGKHYKCKKRTSEEKDKNTKENFAENQSTTKLMHPSIRLWDDIYMSPLLYRALSRLIDAQWLIILKIDNSGKI
uniref:Uncharacterized protein n=1 Tax=Glossina palpalis gambiensis TaxID=67801 RepID=A0A1B0ASD6_9MUSC